MISREPIFTLVADLGEIAAHGTDFIQCPPVYEIIAVKGRA